MDGMVRHILGHAGIGLAGFALIAFVGTQGDPKSVMLKDITGDGVPDIVVKRHLGTNPEYFIGRRDGTFSRTYAGVDRCGVPVLIDEGGNLYYYISQ